MTFLRISPRGSRWIATVVVVVALIAGGLAAQRLLFSGAATTPATGPLSAQTPKEKAVMALINAERTKRGIPALKYDPVMARLARAHNADMIKRNYFAHDSPSQSFAQRVHSVLVMPGRNLIGENIVYGSGSYGTATGLVRSWMASPPHKANILNRGYHRTGLGVTLVQGQYQGGYGITVATQDFSN